MTALPDWGVATDAELAGAAAAGDRVAFAGIYDRYADRLHDFCVGMTRDGDAAADCVQDVFCTAATSLSQLRILDRLRPWLYAIARNEALRHIRERTRERPSEVLPDLPSGEAGPETVAVRTELADLIAEAAGGLSDRDRSVLELTYRHGLDGPELAEALGVSAGSANRMVSRLRDTIERSLGAMLVARTNTGCAGLGAILDGWDGRFTTLMRKRIARHIESCEICDEERRRLVNPVALLGGAPVFIPAPDWLREQTLGEVRLTSASSALHDSNGGRRAATRVVVRTAAMFVASGVAALGVALVWVADDEVAITPTDVTNIGPVPDQLAPPPAVLPPPVVGPAVPVPVPERVPPKPVIAGEPPAVESRTPGPPAAPPPVAPPPPAQPALPPPPLPEIAPPPAVEIPQLPQLPAPQLPPLPELPPPPEWPTFTPLPGLPPLFPQP
jgi:RNA polymerase sigma factor (sigma-70 family)